MSIYILNSIFNFNPQFPLLKATTQAFKQKKITFKILFNISRFAIKYRKYYLKYQSHFMNNRSFPP